MMNDDDEHDDGVTRGLFVMKRAGDCEKDEKWDEKKIENHLILIYKIILIMFKKSLARARWLIKRKIVDLIEDINASDFEWFFAMDSSNTNIFG